MASLPRPWPNTRRLRVGGSRTSEDSEGPWSGCCPQVSTLHVARLALQVPWWPPRTGLQPLSKMMFHHFVPLPPCWCPPALETLSLSQDRSSSAALQSGKLHTCLFLLFIFFLFTIKLYSFQQILLSYLLHVIQLCFYEYIHLIYKSLHVYAYLLHIHIHKHMYTEHIYVYISKISTYAYFCFWPVTTSHGTQHATNLLGNEMFALHLHSAAAMILSVPELSHLKLSLMSTQHLQKFLL